MTDATPEAQTEEKPRPTPSGRLLLPTPSLLDVQIKPIPAPIDNAISTIMGALTTISKGAYNEYGKYNYASVDQIYEAVAPLLAEAGLNIIPVEMAEVMIVAGPDGKNWGKFVIGFVLTAGDAQYFDPHMRETLFIRIEGPQTFSGAKSYAQKSFLRHLFKIATGEPDLDGLPPDEERKPNSKSAPKKAEKPAAEPLSPEGSAKLRAEILTHIGTLRTPLSPEDRSSFAERFGSSIARMIAPDADMVRKAYANAAKAKTS